MPINQDSGLTNNPGALALNDPEISKSAQDTAKAQGNAYEQIATSEENRETPNYDGYDSSGVKNTIDNTIDFKPSSSYIDKAKSTVAGQLGTLLDSSNPYIERASALAKEDAGSRGLRNSTIASQAGVNAAIENALPIAQQDAQTYSQFDKARQSAEYETQKMQSEAIVSGGLVEQKASIDRKNQDIQNAFNSRISGAEQQSKAWLTDLQNTYNVSMKELEGSLSKQITEMKLSSQEAMEVSASASKFLENYQISIENMMTDPDFLGMGAAAVNKAIQEQQQLAGNSIKFVGNANGIDLSDVVDQFITGTPASVM